MSLRFRPQLESLEQRETPTPIGVEPVNPLDPPPLPPPPVVIVPFGPVVPIAP